MGFDIIPFYLLALIISPLGPHLNFFGKKYPIPPGFLIRVRLWFGDMKRKLCPRFERAFNLDWTMIIMRLQLNTKLFH